MIKVNFQIILTFCFGTNFSIEYGTLMVRCFWLQLKAKLRCTCDQVCYFANDGKCCVNDILLLRKYQYI